MLNISSAKRIINEGLYNRLGIGEIKCFKSKNEFTLIEKENDKIFYLMYVKWGAFISISPYGYIRNKVIEKKYGDILGEDWSGNWTVGGNVGEIDSDIDGVQQARKFYHIDIETEADCLKAIDLLVSYYNRCIPFFEKYSEITMLNRLVNESSADQIPVLVCGTLADKCMKGLIISGILGGKGLHSLVNSYDSVIQSLNDKNTTKRYLKVRKAIVGSI
ncbi:MAG: hypothetical protein QM781_13145 [Chitinophagaceae bacterium]